MSDSRRDELIERLKRGVVDYDEEEVAKAAGDVLANDVDVTDAIVNGLASGVEVVGDLFDKGEYFAPEMHMSVEALSAGLNVLGPEAQRTAESAGARGADSDIVRMMFEMADEWGSSGYAETATGALSDAIHRVSTLRESEVEG